MAACVAYAADMKSSEMKGFHSLSLLSKNIKYKIGFLPGKKKKKEDEQAAAGPGSIVLLHGGQEQKLFPCCTHVYRQPRRGAGQAVLTKNKRGYFISAVKNRSRKKPAERNGRTRSGIETEQGTGICGDLLLSNVQDIPSAG